MITYNGNTIEANAYTAALTSEQVQNTIVQILNNVKNYGALSSKIIGEQQRLDDLIKKAEENQDRKALESIVWTYNPLG